MKFFKVGMRTIKTVLAVIITLILAELLNLKSPILAGVAAIMTMESSVSESVTTGKNRMYGTILGAIIGLITSYILFNIYIVDYIFVAIGLVLLISICNFFGWDKATRMAMVVFLVIVLGSDKERLDYAINRSLVTMLGVVIGTGINFFIRPPKTEKYLYNLTIQLRNEVEEAIGNIVLMKRYEEDDIKYGLINLENKYNVFVEDTRYYLRKKNNKREYLKLYNVFDRAKNHIIILNEILNDSSIKENVFFSIYEFHLNIVKEELINIDSYIDKLFH